MTPMPDGGLRWQGRRRAREVALRMLYLHEVGRLSPGDAAEWHGAIGGDEAIGLDDENREYAGRLARGTLDSRETLDEYIAEAARNWRVERLAVVDRLLLRLAVHEILAYPGTPPRVVIDEAIELARIYSGDEATKFVNGVLVGVFRRLKEEGKVVE